jgi:hypothetical protein
MLSRPTQNAVNRVSKTAPRSVSPPFSVRAGNVVDDPAVPEVSYVPRPTSPPEDSPAREGHSADGQGAGISLIGDLARPDRGVEGKSPRQGRAGGPDLDDHASGQLNVTWSRRSGLADGNLRAGQR